MKGGTKTVCQGRATFIQSERTYSRRDIWRRSGSSSAGSGSTGGVGSEATTSTHQTSSSGSSSACDAARGDGGSRRSRAVEGNGRGQRGAGRSGTCTPNHARPAQTCACAHPWGGDETSPTERLKKKERMVTTGLEGFEPPTSGLEARRYILAKPQTLEYTIHLGGPGTLTCGTGTIQKKRSTSAGAVTRRPDNLDQGRISPAVPFHVARDGRAPELDLDPR